METPSSIEKIDDSNGYSSRPTPGMYWKNAMNIGLDAYKKCGVDADKIPLKLKSIDRWVVWKAGPPKEDGKFGKVPLSAKSGIPINTNTPDNWESFEVAYSAYRSGKGDGVGVVLAPEPIWDGLYLVALDLDKLNSDFSEAKELRSELGTYAEISPSLNGARILALSRKLIKGGNDGNNHELYSSKRFMTVTGIGGSGDIVDATEQLQELEKKWFPKQLPTREIGPVTRNLIGTPKPETAENIAQVTDQLNCISADCDYETWRTVVWSVLSSGWGSAENLAHDWSMTAPDRYDEGAFNSLVKSFDPDRGSKLGTLHHYVYKNGGQHAITTKQAYPVTSEGIKFFTADELRDMPRPVWRVRGILPSRGIAAIYGPSGSGKTFVALDLACSIATAQPEWFGNKITTSPVVYIALEGEAGIRDRLSAWEKGQSMKLSGFPIYFLLGNFHLLQSKQVATLIQKINSVAGDPPVVFIDTLNQSSPGMDENASTDMGAAIGGAKRISDETNGAVVLVHHSGKDTSRGLRGHSSLHAAMDSILEVKSQKAGRSWRLSKSKEGESGIQYDFDLSPHLVGKHDDGESVTSCSVKPAIRVPERKKAEPRGKNQKVVYDVIMEIKSGYPDGVPFDKAVECSAKKLEGSRPKPAAKTAIESMVENGTISLTDEGCVM